ncbi:MAG: hypothetical protein IIX14_05075 [Clostridia bacterium]|nr:hypothetical protein [Clostridia bacterium]
MALFKKGNAAPVSERAALQNKLNSARSNILLVVIFSVINTVLCLTGSMTYFLFSANLPYFATQMGVLYTGRFPAEVYGAEWEGFAFYPTSFLVIMAAISVACIVMYLLCWLLSKKHGYGWIIAALVFFIIDTGFMLLNAYDFSEIILDIVFHIWVIVSLIMGISAAKKLKKLPAEEIVPENYPIDVAAYPQQTPFDNAQQPVEAPYTEVPQETVNEIPKED